MVADGQTNSNRALAAHLWRVIDSGVINNVGSFLFRNMRAGMGDSQWYYRQPGFADDTVVGPLSLSEVSALIRSRTLTLKSAVAEPEGQWLSLSDVPQLVQIYNEAEAERGAAIEHQRGNRRATTASCLGQMV